MPNFGPDRCWTERPKAPHKHSLSPKVVGATDNYNDPIHCFHRKGRGETTRDVCCWCGEERSVTGSGVAHGRMHLKRKRHYHNEAV